MNDGAIDVVELLLTAHHYTEERELDENDLPPRVRKVYWKDGQIERPLTVDAGTAEAVVRIPVLPPGAAEGDTLIRMDGVGVRSPGVPGAGDWPGVHAAEALRAVLRQLDEAGRGEAVS
jgi:hypothetical protein